MLRLIFFTFIIASTLTLSAQDLPKGMTDYERSIWEQYLKNYPTDRGTIPPSKNPRTPAEFEEAQGVIITWTSYTSNLREIVRYAKQVAKVYIVCSNPQTVTTYLTQGGVNTNNIEFITASFNSVWVRDYGPQSIYLADTYQLAFVDWVYNRPRPQDDAIPSAVANFMNIPLYQMTVSPNRLVATGGNFMADGFDKGFSSNLIINENSSLSIAQIDTIKKRYMGIEPYIKMTTLPYDGIHHIDMHMKLLDEETLLVGQYPPGVSDGPQIEANLSYILTNFLTPYGRPYRVIRIPMPPDEQGRYPSQGSDYLTYTNSLILNNLVLVPIYNLPLDGHALQIYRDAMPGYQVVGINMRNVIPASGAIHCITREIAAHDPIFISHAYIRDTMNFNPLGYTINAQISTATGVQQVRLYWSFDTTQGYQWLSMTKIQNQYSATIPARQNNGKIFYYIEAKNNNNKTIRKPLVAPAGVYTFYAQGGNTFVDFSSDTCSTTTGNPVTFTVTNQGLQVYSYLWNFGEGAVPSTAEGQGPHTVIYLTTGNKTVSLTINQTYTITKQNMITVNEPLVSTLTVNKVGEGTIVPEPGEYSIPIGTQINFSATPSSGWIFDRWEINSQTFETAQTTLPMVENLVATAYFTQTNSIIPGIGKAPIIYPNPAGQHVFICTLPEESIKAIRIYNLTGTIVIDIENVDSENKIDLSGISAGVYLLEMVTISNTYTHKILKK